MKQTTYWLKTIGSTRWPLDDDWIVSRPELLTGVRAPQQPSGIRSGDRLVYYSAVSKRIFAIARASQDGDNVAMAPGPGEDQWPFLLPVQLLLAIPTLKLAPSWDVLDISDATISQKSYVEIDEATYAAGWQAIVDRTSPAHI
jgi:hypothetical protein